MEDEECNKDSEMLTPTDIFPGFKGVLKKSLKDRKFQGAQHAKGGNDESKPVEEQGRKDAWSQYMQEVRMYKEKLGDEEPKTRPLVK
ncbi:unnamed protein product [Darwinula stevensoni]|uniref:Telomerase RNA component interacting RNase n=1 Tax=Darwinula stevensoni TaxID=69355 RepID=A0A7R8WZZ1_9CRUS|nr:unnamed protein product [Darwinula stevensoni]CAG0881103.1 unnamed protein product [Darwinula stevensoni]